MSWGGERCNGRQGRCSLTLQTFEKIDQNFNTCDSDVFYSVKIKFLHYLNHVADPVHLTFPQLLYSPYRFAFYKLRPCHL